MAHTWTFFRAGGLDQVLISTADDLRHLGELDQKLWVALSCPVKGLEFDQRTLELIDGDKDGRVRVPELVAAVDWACARLKDPAVLLTPPGTLALASIADGTDDGKAILASAKRILSSLGKPDSATISAEDTADTVKIFGQMTFNGDGIITAECATDAGVKAALEDLLATQGPETDRSGKPGTGKDRIGKFFSELAAFDGWWKHGEDASKPGSGVLPLGEATPGAFAALVAVRAKVSDWFARTRLAAFDARATEHLNRAAAEYTALAVKDLSSLGDDVAGLPLQQVSGTAKELDLAAGVNPAWAARIDALRAAVIGPILGADKRTIGEADWTAVCAKFAAYEAWQGSKAGASVEKLGIARVRALLAGPTRAALEALVEKDLAVAPELAALEAVDRLARYQRDLALLLRNFVNFADFYDTKPPPPIFVAGRLYLDQRTAELCIRVDDPGAHAALANLGKVYIAYVACTRPSGEKMTVAAAFTQGDSDFLMVGRNGVFYDRKGRDWDATIVKLLDHPISIRQAFWSPYKRIGKMISDTVEKIAGDADKAATAKASATVGETAEVAQGTKPAAGAAPSKIDTGMLAAIGIAATSLVSALSGIAAALFGIPAWKVPLVVLGAILAISGPSMVIAFLKLRQRTLGPLLEANGWAINGRVKINIPLGTSLTHAMKLPANSRRMLDDPFEDKAARRRARWLTVATVLVVGAAGYWFWVKPTFLDAPTPAIPAAAEAAVPK